MIVRPNSGGLQNSDNVVSSLESSETKLNNSIKMGVPKVYVVGVGMTKVSSIFFLVLFCLMPFSRATQRTSWLCVESTEGYNIHGNYCVMMKHVCEKRRLFLE